MCTICDMEPQQQRLSRILGVCEERPYFHHPTSEEPVFFMYDPPHLIKSLRNALMNYDIGFGDGSIASWNFLKTLWSLDTARSLRLVPRLTAKHIFLGLGKKMCVRLAVQTFSHSVYAGLMTYKARGLLHPDAQQTAIFVKTMNDLWDAFNCSDLRGRGFKQVITRGNLSARLDLLNSASSFIRSFVFHRLSKKPVSKTYLPSKTGLLITISAYKSLINHLLCDSPVPMNFLVGRRFNQDCVENCFSQVRRDKGSFFEMLPCWRAVSNLKCVAASTFLSPVRKFYANCQNDDDRIVIDLFQSSVECEKKTTKKFELDPTSSDKNTSLCVSRREASQTAIRELWRDTSESPKDLIQNDATEYVAGYLIQKMFSKNSDIVKCTPCVLSLVAQTDELSTFLSHKSFVVNSCGLQIPSLEFVTLVSKWDQYFRSTFNSLCRSRQLKMRLVNILFSKTDSIADRFLPHCHKKCVLNFCLELFVKLKIFKEVKVGNENLKRDRIASLRKLSKMNSSLKKT